MNKNEERLSVYKLMEFEFVLFGKYGTYEAFLEDFEERLIKACGECTEEDIKWAYEMFSSFVVTNTKVVAAYEERKKKEKEKKNKK